MKKRKKITWPVALLIVLTTGMAIQGCTYSGAGVIKGDGNIFSASHQLDHFKVINIAGMYDVKLSQGDDAVVVLETDSNIQEITDIRVRDNTLYIRSTEEGVIRPTHLKMHITFPELEKVVIGGACKLTSDVGIVTEKLVIDVSGAASIILKLAVDELITSIAGAASIVYEGEALTHRADLSGASSLRAEKLVTQSTNVSLSGAGSAHVFASGRLDAILSGLGSIRYYGDPEELITGKSGLGTIRKAD